MNFIGPAYWITLKVVFAVSIQNKYDIDLSTSIIVWLFCDDAYISFCIGNGWRMKVTHMKCKWGVVIIKCTGWSSLVVWG